MPLLRNRATRLMIVVFVGVLLFAATLNAVREQGRPVRPTPAPVPYLFPDVLTTTITRIEITNVRFNRYLALVKAPGEWLGSDKGGKPVPVDMTIIPPMLSILTSLRYTEIMDSSQVDLAKFGLTNGGWFVVKFDSAGKSYTLAIGDANPSRTLSYVQVQPDTRVFLADYNLVGRLVSVVDVRDPQELATPTP
jgi:Domain of unknown function (DUF4340)